MFWFFLILGNKIMRVVCMEDEWKGYVCVRRVRFFERRIYVIRELICREIVKIVWFNWVCDIC